MNPTPLPSNRSFGWVFVVFFSLVAAYGWWRGGTWYRWPLGLGVLTLACTLLAPALLTPFNRAWMKFGDILGRIVSPVVLGLIFFGMFAPIAIGMRLAGRDALKRSFDPAMRSYWNERSPPGPDPTGMPNQF
ncbi:MAG: hypothetical protein JNM79_10335 [Burkholderiales bacterium]|nr:hypothetical protein [Burkholderiales bacterium]